MHFKFLEDTQMNNHEPFSVVIVKLILVCAAVLVIVGFMRTIAT